MTTIAYKDGVMAGDTQVTQQGTIIGRARKVFKYHGHLFGTMGISSECQDLLAWAKAGMKGHPPRFEESQMLVVSPKGHLRLLQNGLFVSWKANGFAIGSGRDHALAVMEYGGDAVDAVAIACRLDNGTSKPIHVVRLDSAG